MSQRWACLFLEGLGCWYCLSSLLWMSDVLRSLTFFVYSWCKTLAWCDHIICLSVILPSHVISFCPGYTPFSFWNCCCLCYVLWGRTTLYFHGPHFWSDNTWNQYALVIPLHSLFISCGCCTNIVCFGSCSHLILLWLRLWHNCFCGCFRLSCFFYEGF